MSKRGSILAPLLGACALLSTSLVAASDEASIERGRYLVMTTGCNDCHTPQYTAQDGNVPEQQWLIGHDVGWRGPWGISYATNLRHRIHGMSEAQWIEYARTLKSRPPMPWFSLNVMNEADLRAIYRFVRALGDSDNPVPAALAPEERPRTPYVDMSVVQ